jgi:hypothetical protein
MNSTIKKIIALCLMSLIPMLSAFAQKEKKDSTWRRHSCVSRLNTDQPLIVMNGIDVRDIRGGFEDIKPKEISEIKILKGQEAIDKYGEKGKNGVIQYTIKRKMDLISSGEILQNVFKDDSCKTQKLIFKPIEGMEEEYDHTRVVYFMKSKITLKEASASGDCIVIVEQKN